MQQHNLGNKDEITEFPVEDAKQFLHTAGRHLIACCESPPCPESMSGSCKMPIVSCSLQTPLEILPSVFIHDLSLKWLKLGGECERLAGCEPLSDCNSEETIVIYSDK